MTLRFCTYQQLNTAGNRPRELSTIPLTTQNNLVSTSGQSAGKRAGSAVDEKPSIKAISNRPMGVR